MMKKLLIFSLIVVAGITAKGVWAATQIDDSFCTNKIIANSGVSMYAAQKDAKTGNCVFVKVQTISALNRLTNSGYKGDASFDAQVKAAVQERQGQLSSVYTQDDLSFLGDPVGAVVKDKGLSLTANATTDPVFNCNEGSNGQCTNSGTACGTGYTCQTKSTGTGYACACTKSSDLGPDSSSQISSLTAVVNKLKALVIDLAGRLGLTFNETTNTVSDNSQITSSGSSDPIYNCSEDALGKCTNEGSACGAGYTCKSDLLSGGTYACVCHPSGPIAVDSSGIAITTANQRFMNKPVLNVGDGSLWIPAQISATKYQMFNIKSLADLETVANQAPTFANLDSDNDSFKNGPEVYSGYNLYDTSSLPLTSLSQLAGSKYTTGMTSADFSRLFTVTAVGVTGETNYCGDYSGTTKDNLDLLEPPHNPNGTEQNSSSIPNGTNWCKPQYQTKMSWDIGGEMTAFGYPRRVGNSWTWKCCSLVDPTKCSDCAINRTPDTTCGSLTVNAKDVNWPPTDATKQANFLAEYKNQAGLCTGNGLATNFKLVPNSPTAGKYKITWTCSNYNSSANCSATLDGNTALACGQVYVRVQLPGQPVDNTPILTGLCLPLDDPSTDTDKTRDSKLMDLADEISAKRAKGDYSWKCKDPNSDLILTCGDTIPGTGCGALYNQNVDSATADDNTAFSKLNTCPTGSTMQKKFVSPGLFNSDGTRGSGRVTWECKDAFGNIAKCNANINYTTSSTSGSVGTGSN